MNVGYFKKFRAACNQMVCTAHIFQLSVRVLLGHEWIKHVLDKGRTAARAFRKLSVELVHMKKAFTSSADFRQHLRPLLDVPTRWGSTLAMCKQCCKIDPMIKDAHQSLLREQWSSAGAFGEHIKPTEMILIDDLIKILQDLDDATILLGKTSDPLFQEVEIITASILASLSKLSSSNGDSASIDRLLLSDTLQCRRKLFNDFPVTELVLQVSTFLTPEYEKGNHKKYLGECVPYTMYIKQEVKVIFKLTWFFIRDVAVNSGSLSNENEKFSRSYSPLDRLVKVLSDDDQMDETLNEDNEIEKEMAGYQVNAKRDANRCPLTFSKTDELLCLANVAKLVFSALSCWNRSGRLFSLAGIVRSKHRARLSGQMTEFIIKSGHFPKQKYAAEDR